MVDSQHLDAEFSKQVKNFKIRGSSAKVNLSLDALPNFTSMPGDGPHLAGAISISPSLDYIERAYDDAKYGDFSRRPYMDIILPSMLDPSMAPPGKHVMSIFVQYAPYHLKYWHLAGKTRSLRRHRHRHAERIRAELERHHSAPPSRHAVGS